MAEFPALPLWTDAYLADTRHLTTTEHGAYLLLLMECWRRPRCSLPCDDELLSRLAGMSIEDWYSIKSTVLAFFTHDKKRNEIRQKRLVKEHEYVAKKVDQKRHAAAKRWNNTKKDHANAYAEGMREACIRNAPTPTPTPTPILEERTPPKTPPPTQPPKPPGKPEVRSAKPRCEREFAAFWRDYPRREGKGAAEKAYAKALARAGPDEILAGVARYRDRIERDGTEKRFVAHPATWLNQDRWMDEETDIGRPNGSGDWSARAEIVTAAMPWMADLPTERDIAEQGRLKAKLARPPADLLRLPGRRDGLPDGREP